MSTHPIVLSFDVDAIIVESTLSVIGELRDEMGFDINETSLIAAQFLADQVESFRPISVEDYLDGDYDPTPMHQWQVTEGVSASEQYERVMQVVRDLENGAA